MRPTKTRSTYKSSSSSDQKIKQLAFLAALLFLIAAIISIYIAWKDLREPNGTEIVV